MLPVDFSKWRNRQCQTKQRNPLKGPQVDSSSSNDSESESEDDGQSNDDDDDQIDNEPPHCWITFKKTACPNNPKVFTIRHVPIYQMNRQSQGRKRKPRTKRGAGKLVVSKPTSRVIPNNPPLIDTSTARTDNNNQQTALPTVLPYALLQTFETSPF